MVAKSRFLLAFVSVFAVIITIGPQSGDQEADRWTVYNVANTSMASFFLTEIYEDSQGRLWFAGFDNGASLLDDGALTTYNDANSEIAARVTSFTETPDGTIWVGTEEGIHFFDKTGLSRPEEGELKLPITHVTALFRDSDDRTWVGTWGGGVAVVDGDQWTTYTTDDGLAGDHIWAFMEGSDGRIWVGTRSGVSVYSPGDLDDAWTTYTTESSDLAGNQIRVFLEDSQGDIWIGTAGKGVNILKTDGTWDSFTDEDGLPSNFVTSLAQEEDGTYWVGTEGGLVSFQSGIWTPYEARRDLLPHHFVEDILIDDDGLLWFATFGGGAATWDGETWEKFDPDTTGLDSNQINVFLEDSKGNIWVGTTYGLHKFDGRAWQTFTEFNSDLTYHYITGLVEDRQGRIWVGTLEGVSVLEPDGTWIEYDRFGDGPPETRLPSNTIFTVFYDSEDRIWMGTGLGAAVLEDGEWTLYHIRNSGLNTNLVSVITEDSLGRVWFTHWQGINIFDSGNWNTLRTENSAINTNLVWASMEDSRGRMWFGTLGDGIAIFDGQTWVKHNRSTGALTHDSVRSIVEDRQGRFWVATDGGVNLLADDGRLWMAYTAFNTPLPHNFVNTLLLDSKGNIWIGTQDGLAIFRPGTGANPVLDQARNHLRGNSESPTGTGNGTDGYTGVSGDALGEGLQLSGLWAR